MGTNLHFPLLTAELTFYTHLSDMPEKTIQTSSLFISQPRPWQPGRVTVPGLSQVSQAQVLDNRIFWQLGCSWLGSEEGAA